jgi:hypothetical protein
VEEMTLLYKYRTFSSSTDQRRLFDIIRTSTFWFAKATEVNDPFEFKCAVDFSWDMAATIKAFSIVELSQNLKTTPEKALEEAERVLTRVPFEKLKLRQRELAEEIWHRVARVVTMCCFAGTPLSNLMWSHYAAGHSGVCVEIDATSLSEYIYPVVYSDSPPIISPLALVDVETGKGQQLFESLFLRKATCWSYEAEQRIMRVDRAINLGIRSHASAFVRDSIRRVIVGTAMMPHNREFLMEHIKRYAPVVGLGFAVPSNEAAYTLKVINESEFGL